MRKIILLFVGLCLIAHQLSAQELVLSGKIRSNKPVSIEIKTLFGKEVLSLQTDKKGEFKKQCQLAPDVYRFSIGSIVQLIYLTPGEVTVRGFYNEGAPQNSSFDFTGIDSFLQLTPWIPQERNAAKRVVDPEVTKALPASLLAPLAVLSDFRGYESNRILWDAIPEEIRQGEAAHWLEHRVDSLKAYAVGEPAYNFSFPDQNGKMVSLSDFKGKFVLVDFWASWCGPCRQEMKNLAPIYEELKGDDLEFISISIDNKEKDWRRMLEEENHPWVMLWDSEGFTAGNEPNKIQRAYGFYSIPFIVLIDKEGRLLERKLRGEEVKNAILRARGERTP